MSSLSEMFAIYSEKSDKIRLKGIFNVSLDLLFRKIGELHYKRVETIDELNTLTPTNKNYLEKLEEKEKEIRDLSSEMQKNEDEIEEFQKMSTFVYSL